MDNASLPAIPPNIGEMAAQLMSNPQIMNIMNGMNNYTQSGQNRPGQGSVRPDDAGGGDIAQLMSRLMSDPQVMGLISSLGGMQSSGGDDRNGGGEPAERGSSDRAGGYDKPDGAGGYDKPDRPGSYDKPDRAGGYDKPDRAGGYDKPDRAGNYDRPDSPDKSDGGDHRHIRAGSDRDRIALLCALKPYLGDSRRRKIEGMLKVLELVEFARTTHLLDNILPGFGELK